MKSVFKVLLCVCALSVGGAAYAGPFEDGMAAHAANSSGDYLLAFQIWQHLADQGDSNAQANLGRMYREGRGIIQDYAEAAKWTTKSAEQGYDDAWVDLGDMYIDGIGVEQDIIAAYMWLNVAAAQSEQGRFAKRYAIEQRSLVVQRMTPSQLEKAQELSRKCLAQNYKSCGQ